MKFHAPTALMKLVTKCERVQPTCAGVDAKGELIWEGRAMPRWQMEMFKRIPDWFGEFFTRWIEVKDFEEDLKEFDVTRGGLAAHRAASKEYVNQLRIQNPPKLRKAWRRTGD